MNGFVLAPRIRPWSLSHPHSLGSGPGALCCPLSNPIHGLVFQVITRGGQSPVHRLDQFHSGLHFPAASACVVVAGFHRDCRSGGAVTACSQAGCKAGRKVPPGPGSGGGDSGIWIGACRQRITAVLALDRTVTAARSQP